MKEYYADKYLVASTLVVGLSLVGQKGPAVRSADRLRGELNCLKFNEKSGAWPIGTRFAVLSFSWLWKEVAMPGFGVIGDVSETLEGVLTDALSTLAPGPPEAKIHDLQKDPPTNPPTLAIFLYRIIEDPSTRNRPPVREQITAGAVPTVVHRKPPLTLLLQYLLTPFSGEVLTDQRMLGRAMQVLYDHPIFAAPDFKGTAPPHGLIGTDEALKTTLSPLTLEELTRVWWSVQRPYRLSLTYEVRVANIDTEETFPRRLVRSRNLDLAQGKTA